MTSETVGAPPAATALRRGIADTLLGAQIYRAQKRMQRHFEAWFRDDEMTTLQFSILNLIELNPQMSQKELASHSSVEPASFGESLVRLEGKGLIAREPDARDRRAKVVRLTAAGKAMLDRMVAQVHAMERHYASNLTEAEQARLLQLLEKLNGERRAGASEQVSPAAD